jgi:hypothetical protein
MSTSSKTHLLPTPPPTPVARRTKYICIEATPSIEVDLSLVAVHLAIRLSQCKPAPYVFATKLDISYNNNNNNNNNNNSEGANGDQLAPLVRHFLNEAEHAHHLSHVVAPNLSRYDYIIQAHGALKLLQIGDALGCSRHTIVKLMHTTLEISIPTGSRNRPTTLYDAVYMITLASEPATITTTTTTTASFADAEFCRMFHIVPVFVTTTATVSSIVEQLAALIDVHTKML